MSEVDRELARLLARSSLGERLMAVDAELRRLISEDVFDDLEPRTRQRLDRLAADAGGRALYAFLVPYLEAVTAFVEEHADAALQSDRYPARAPMPLAGDWIRSDDGIRTADGIRTDDPIATDGIATDAEPAGRGDRGDGLWHLFGGDVRLRVVGRSAETFAEARCGRLLPISSPAGPANLERVATRPTANRCRVCRRISVRTGRLPRPRRPAV